MLCAETAHSITHTYKDTLAAFLFIIVMDYALRHAFKGKEQKLSFTFVPRKSVTLQTWTTLMTPACYLTT